MQNEKLERIYTAIIERILDEDLHKFSYDRDEPTEAMSRKVYMRESIGHCERCFIYTDIKRSEIDRIKSIYSNVMSLTKCPTKGDREIDRTYGYIYDLCFDDTMSVRSKLVFLHRIYKELEDRCDVFVNVLKTFRYTEVAYECDLEMYIEEIPKKRSKAMTVLLGELIKRFDDGKEPGSF